MERRTVAVHDDWKCLLLARRVVCNPRIDVRDRVRSGFGAYLRPSSFAALLNATSARKLSSNGTLSMNSAAPSESKG